MKLMGRTLVVLAVALVVVGVWLAIGALSGSTGTTGTMAGAMGGPGMGGQDMDSGFTLAGSVQILPALAIVALVTVVVAPIKHRLLDKHHPDAAAHHSEARAPDA